MPDSCSRFKIRLRDVPAGMTERETSVDIVIVGGGVIGCAAARELAPDHDVLVIEKDQIAGNATGRASGLITYSAQRSALPSAATFALDFFHDYTGTEQYEFTHRNTVELVPEGNVETAHSRVSGAREAGFPLSYLETEEVTDRYPGVFDMSEYDGAIEFGDTGLVDPYTFTMSLKDDAESAGAEVWTGVTVQQVTTDDGRVSGVDTDKGFVEGETVVIAAGWQTRQLLKEFVKLPIRPFRYQTVNLQPSEPVVDDGYPIGLEPISGFYWRPEENGELHIGGGEYLVEQPGSVRETVTEEFRMSVASTVPDRLQGFDQADIISEDTCPTGDAATPDALPIIDSPAEVPDGIIIAAGFHGYGIMEAPIGGAAVRAIVTGEDVPFPLASYTLDRFGDRSTDFELVSLSEKRVKHH